MDIQVKDAQGNISHIELPEGSTCIDLAQNLRLHGPGQAVAVSINEVMKDPATLLRDKDTVRFYSFEEPIGQEVFWHSSAHVLAQAILRLYPNAKPTIGPAIENGFYYDFADLTVSDADFEKINKEMQTVCEENYKPKREVFSSKEDAIKRFSTNKYKKELLEGFDETGEFSAYSQGEFFDLCRGPHLSSLGKIKAICVLKTSGAYWRGDAKNEMLTRIYGISFPDRKLLKEYLHKLEEAKKRDHKLIGPKLDLFSIHEEAPGTPFIHPKGMVIWNKLLEYWRECHKKADYVEIKTPTMMVKDLWVRSGHWENYRENMFTSEIEKREFAIKPMNCPGAMLFYKCASHSYRELPLRVAEIGHVHRYEPSGALSGLFRVRAFHQDDAHIFMKPSDIQDEIHSVLQLVDGIYSTFGLSYELALSTRPASHTIGTDEEWKVATDGLKNALVANGKPFIVNEGDGAFYGPKIDFRVVDALGRKWQCGTIQLDMALPERFDLEYTTSEGTKARPVMIHRVIYGSIERFFGALIEFYTGKFPLWLSPSQIMVIPVADRHLDYAKKIQKALKGNDLLTDVDDSHESVSKKIRSAQIQQYNYMITVGDQEANKQTISLRTRDNVVHGEISLNHFIENLVQERDKKLLYSLFKHEG